VYPERLEIRALQHPQKSRLKSAGMSISSRNGAPFASRSFPENRSLLRERALTYRTALDHRLWKRRAIEFHHRPSRATAAMMIKFAITLPTPLRR
jgi:hypothetical protein